MIFTRKIGKLIRGNTTAFQLYAAALLGAFLGFTPGFDHAPGLVLFWAFLLLILNANLFLAGLIGLLSKLIYLIALPTAFSIGRVLLEGPTQGLFEILHNAPVTAYFGLDYYSVVGGQALGLMFGLVSGFLATRGLDNYRKRKALHQDDDHEARARKKWVKVFEWIFVGTKSGRTYDELLARRIGNPIRVIGVILVVVMIGLIVLAGRLFTDPWVASMARSGLSTVNGATVDLESAHLDLDEGRLEFTNVAFADPNQLDTDILRSNRIVADVSTADILRKRFSIENLVIDSASSGLTRESSGKLVGPRSGASKMPELEMPDFKDLESILENAEVWKARLTQVKRWLDRIGTAKPEILSAPQQWEEEISSRIRSLGYANVKANILTKDSPLLWLRNLEALGVKSEQLDGMLIDIKASNLSTHPYLVEDSPSVSIRSKDGTLEAQLSLGLAAGRPKNDLNFVYKGIPTSALSKSIQADGKPLLKGGTIDLNISGDLNAVDSDLVARTRFKDVSLMIAGSTTSLDGMEMPLAIRGPIDSPRVKLGADFLKKALTQAGKKKLLEKASEELGIDLGEDTSAEGLGKAAGELLGGLLNKKSEKKK